MTRWALMGGDTVLNVVEQEQAPGDFWIDCGDTMVGPGWKRVGNDWQVQVLPRIISRFAFRARFSATEKAKIEVASLDVPTATLPDRMAAAALRAGFQDISAAEYVDLDRADLRARVQALETAGLLDAAGRAAAILDAPIAADELPTR